MTASHQHRHHVHVGKQAIPLPASRWARIAIGIALIVAGIFGFLPILGFWMIPLGVLVLSYDLPFVARWRDGVERWWHKRRRKRGH